ncbi:3-deoxy-D-manno-octulosonate 8-phosphate phosphatase KdsC [compost metagenome]
MSIRRDDSIDLPAFAVCGISFAVADAPAYVKAAATQTLVSTGGTGAFREVADAILFAQNKMASITTAAGYASVMNKMSQ